MNESQNTAISAEKVRGVPFKKGFDKRRNLKGYPEGQPNFNTLFEQAIKRVAKEKNMKITDVELIAVAIKKMLYGDYKFYKDTMDRRFGAPERGTEVNIDNRKIEISWISKCPKCGEDL